MTATRLTETLRSAKPTLCVSLVANDVEMAKAVADAGADGLKVHLNLNHPYANTRLGTFEEEADRLRAIIEGVSIPVGIVPRGSAGTTISELEQYAAFGFDFVDLYSNVMDARTLSVPGIDRWVAPKGPHTPGMLEALADIRSIDVIEASFLGPAEYGAPLSVSDLAELKVGLKAIGGRKPLVLPTDRGLSIDDVPVLVENGIVNLLIGYAVTGNDASVVAATTDRFRRALDAAWGGSRS